MTVTNLYIKRKHGAALEKVTTLAFDKSGISGGTHARECGNPPAAMLALRFRDKADLC